MAGTLGGDGEAVELARQADGEVADVDHLLHLAEALGDDLAGFQRDQPAELGLVGAQLLTEQAHQFAAPRRRHIAPGLEGGDGTLDRVGDIVGAGLGDARDLLAGDRRAHRAGAAAPARIRHAEGAQELRDLFRDRPQRPRVSFVAILTLLASDLVRRAHSTGDGAKSISAFDVGHTAEALDSNPNYLSQRCPMRGKSNL